jgi:uncharacterized membrane protein YphA (DoxX/SURF4 family)
MRARLASLFQPQVPMILLVLVRVIVGGALFIQGSDKLNQGYFERVGKNDTEVSHPLQIRLKVWIEEERAIGRPGAGQTVRMLHWYRFFLENAVLPNLWVFAILVTVAELTLGAMLLAGLLTRVASFMGIVLLINYLFATWHYGFPYLPLNALFLALLLVFLIAGVGRCLGVDTILHERYPEIPLF